MVFVRILYQHHQSSSMLDCLLFVSHHHRKIPTFFTFLLPVLFLFPSPLPRLASPQIADGQYSLTIDAGDIAKEYTIPGQYVQIRVGPDAKANFFAIASAPDPRCVGAKVLWAPACAGSSFWWAGEGLSRPAADR